MRVVYGLGKIKRFKNVVVVLGIFDGVHRAHQFILKRVSQYAKNIKAKTVVITFYPHPQAESSLSSLPHRLRLIEDLSLDICVVINFTKSFSRISADYFIRNIVIKKFSPQAIFVGENFTFGRYARGDISLLKKYTRLYNFRLKVIPTIIFNNKIISSSLIRRLIMRGELQEAERMLGRPVSILGTVVKGTALGRRWGIPTANVNPHHEVMPPLGIYAAKVKIFNRMFKAACYIGTKSTFKQEREKFIEVHIIDFKKNIYGKDLEIQFVKKIRNDRKFTSEIRLVRQIKKDIEQAKKILS